MINANDHPTNDFDNSLRTSHDGISMMSHALNHNAWIMAECRCSIISNDIFFQARFWKIAVLNLAVCLVVAWIMLGSSANFSHHNANTIPGEYLGLNISSEIHPPWKGFQSMRISWEMVYEFQSSIYFFDWSKIQSNRKIVSSFNSLLILKEIC